MRERLGWAKDACADLDPAWAQQGETLLLQMRAAVHGEVDAAQVNPIEPDVRRWQSYVRELEREARISGAPSLRHWLAHGHDSTGG